MTFDEVINKLSKGKLAAKFMPNDYTDKSRKIPYGYYYIQDAPLDLGAVMINVTYVNEMEETADSMVDIKTLNEQNVWTFAHDDKRVLFNGNNSFKKAISLIKSMETTRSVLSKNEAFMLWYHFNDSEEAKQALDKHYLNARVMYDTMHQMMGHINGTKFFHVNHGYVIETQFDDNSVEVMHIKQTLERNTYNNLYRVMQIAIPSIRLQDKFDDYTFHTEMMLFKKAEKFIGIANGNRYDHNIDTPESFYRYDDAYMNLMRQIEQHRVKAQ